MFWLIVSACAIVIGAWIISILWEVAENPEKWTKEGDEHGHH